MQLAAALRYLREIYNFFDFSFDFQILDDAQTSEHDHGKSCLCNEERRNQEGYGSGCHFPYACRFSALADKTMGVQWKII